MERQHMLARGRYVVADPDELPGGGVFEHGAVVIDGDRVVAVGRYDELRERHPEARELGSERHVILPGLVNAHQHGQGLSTIQLGLLDDFLEPWAAAFWARCHPLDIYLDTLYAAARMIRAGVTTAVHFGYGRGLGDVEAETRAALRAYGESGLRVAFGLEVSDRATFVYEEDDVFLDSLPEPVAASARSLVADAFPQANDEVFALLERLCEENADNPRVKLLLAPAGPQWCSDDLLRRVSEAARSLGVGIQAHCLESAYQREIATSFYGTGTLEHLERMGVLGESTSLAHSVWLSDSDIERCAATGTSIAHNPSSNLRLRVGISPINRMLEAGVTVGVGTDGMALGDDEGMLEELRLATRFRGLPVGLREAPAPASADTLRMGTVNGGRLSTFGSSCGRLVPGGFADLIVLDYESITHPFLEPSVDVLDALVYRAKSSDIVTVVAGGRILLDEGRLVGIDEQALASELAALAGAAIPEQARSAMDVRRSLQPHVAAFYAGWRPRGARPSYDVNALGDEREDD
jgi:5-methylthioadenosine/S-adenosylhomocysteine deaminase